MASLRSQRCVLCCIVFLLSLASAGFQLAATRLAANLVDPIMRIQGQDEAVYASSAIGMAERGGWLTPRFMGRLALYKPPFLYWCSALAIKVAGVSEAALRAPSAIAAALAATILFLWLWQTRCVWAGATAMLLLLSSRMIHTLARTAMMDALILMWTVAAMAIVQRDPALRRRRSAVLFGAIAGLAVMTKAVAGVVPFIILAIYCACLRSEERPAIRRLAMAVAVAAAVALPWHLYQLAVHPLWFWNEYILTEHLALGLSSPQITTESHSHFYATRLWYTDPALCIAAILALPALMRGIRSRNPQALLIGAWIAGVLLTLFAFQYRAAWYLTPLIAALVVAAAQYAPWLNRQVAVALLVVVAVLKISLHDRSFGLPYGPESLLEPASKLEAYCRSGNPAPLFLSGIDDQFYATDLAIPEVHYVMVDPTASRMHGTLDFGYLGIIVTEDEFEQLEALRPVFRKRLEQWGVDSGDAIASMILTRDARSAASLVARGGSLDPNRHRGPGWCGSPR